MCCQAGPSRLLCNYTKPFETPFPERLVAELVSAWQRTRCKSVPPKKTLPRLWAYMDGLPSQSQLRINSIPKSILMAAWDAARGPTRGKGHRVGRRCGQNAFPERFLSGFMLGRELRRKSVHGQLCRSCSGVGCSRGLLWFAAP